MSNNTSNTSNKNKTAENSEQPIENEAVTAVEVVKDDTVVYEDGDFEEYNAEHDYQEDTADNSVNDAKSGDDKSDKSDKNKDTDKNQQPNKEQASKKDSKSEKDEKSNEDDTDAQEDESAQKEDADEKSQSEQDDTSGMTMSGIFQWASKLREGFMSEATDMTSGVTEKAAVIALERLIAVVDMELAAFDKSVEAAKKLIANVEEERTKIASRKEKYQDMIDNLDQDE